MPRSLADIDAVRLIVGLEVHVELATRTKVFAAVGNPAHPEFDGAPPNSLIDPVVLGLPGALPVLNREAVEMSIRVGLALNCRIAEQSKWDRKSYFYPDLPKGYQISQYDLPICFDGGLDIALPDEHGQPDLSRGIRRIGILRAHLEEDAGKLLHEAPGGLAIDGSIADYNRAGAPLLEIVTQPDFAGADEVVVFCRALRNICRFLGASEGVLQKGHMRFEPNINCALTLRDGREVRTPIVEVKNLNSFRAVKGAIEAELRDQPERWVQTGLEFASGTKQTRGFDERAIGEAGGGPSGGGGATVLQREKEEAHDYRYFPDPDLPVLAVDRAWVNAVQASIPTLPEARYRRYVGELGLSPKEATALVDERDDCLFFERAMELMVQRGVTTARAPKTAANLVLQSGLKRANEARTRRPEAEAESDEWHAPDAIPDATATGAPVLVSGLGITAEQVAAIGIMREDGRLSAANADMLFGILCEPAMRGRDAEGVAEFRGLLTVRDDAKLDAWVDQVIAENGPIVEQIKGGKVQAIGRLVGAAMKLSAGAGDARVIRERLLERMGVRE